MRVFKNRIVMCTGLVSTFLLVPADVNAQDTGANARAKAAAADFFRVINDKIVRKPDGGQAVARKNGKVMAGYYRVKVIASSDTRSSEFSKGCKTALRGLGNSKIKDILFDRKYDLGLSLSLPLKLVPEGFSDGDNTENLPRIEFSLFNFTRERKKCKLSVSFLETNDNVVKTPWTPIDQRFLADPQVAEIKFKPWASRVENKSNVKGFLNFASKLVSVFVPVNIERLLTTEQSITGKIARQVNDRFVHMPTGAHTGDIQEGRKFLTIDPNEGGEELYRPGTLDFGYELHNQEEKNTFDAKINFNLSVDYRASLFANGQSYPQFSDQQIDRLASLASSPSVGFGSDKAWNEITDNIVNLAKQKKPGRFSAACGPAARELSKKGMSYSDRSLLIYALARGENKFTKRQVLTIECLQSPDSRASLARFGITLEKEGPFLALTKPSDWKAALGVLTSALKSPSSVDGRGDKKLKNYLAEKVWVSIDPKQVGSAGEHQDVSRLSRDEFLVFWKSFKPAYNVGCYAPRESAWEDQPAVFGFPGGSGMDLSERQLATLVRYSHNGQTKVLLAIASLAGKDADGFPLIDGVWMGGPPDKFDDSYGIIRTDMRKNTRCLDINRPFWQEFLLIDKNGNDIVDQEDETVSATVNEGGEPVSSENEPTESNPVVTEVSAPRPSETTSGTSGNPTTSPILPAPAG